MKKTKKIVWILVGLGALFLLLMLILSSVLDIGEKLNKVSPVLEYVFYGVAGILVFFLVINPIRIIMFAPSLNISSKMDKKRKRKSVYKKVAKNIIANNDLKEQELNSLKHYETFDDLKLAIDTCYNGTIKDNISDIIYRNAKTVMISTAISQNSTLDMYSVISINLKMIKEIVLASGFRPSYKNLGKLSVNVLTTALVAEGLENLNLEDVLPNSTMSTLGEIPFIKPLVSSIMQGAANGLLTLRIGFVCRRYLFAELGETKQQIRVSAFKESVKMLPRLIADVATFFPNKIVKLFTKKEVKEETA
ncbi:MAG: DUF697 domain-containing protein [bacterium]